MKLRSEEVHAFLGKRGTGKSTRCKEMLSKLTQRVVVFDYHDEYSADGKSTKQVHLGTIRTRMEITTLMDDETVLDDEDLSLAVIPRRGRREAAEDFKLLVELVGMTGHLVFVADEVGHWGEYAENELNELACQSRHDDVPCVFLAQRAVQIPKTARTQITRLNSGRQDDPADLQALREVAGASFAHQVSRLGKGECADWRDDHPKKERTA